MPLLSGCLEEMLVMIKWWSTTRRITCQTGSLASGKEVAGRELGAGRVAPLGVTRARPGLAVTRQTQRRSSRYCAGTAACQHAN